MATHPSILAWRVPWTEELAGHSPSIPKRVGHNLVAQQQQQPVDTRLSFLQLSCLNEVVMFREFLVFYRTPPPQDADSLGKPSLFPLFPIFCFCLTCLVILLLNPSHFVLAGV